MSLVSAKSPWDFVSQILDTLSKMCGIFMCLSEDEASGEDLLQTLASSLKNRGPDNAKEIRLQIKLDSGKTVHATFLGCVLWLRGAEMTKQPLVDSENNVLLWNGDIFEGDILKSDSHGKYSDTEILSKKLQSLPDEQIHAEISRVRGPFAFVYYRPSSNKIWFGRDFFGRHSLLLHTDHNQIVFSSLGHRKLSKFREVLAGGICLLNLQEYFDSETENSGLYIYPWTERKNVDSFFSDFEILNSIESSVTKMLETNEFESFSNYGCDEQELLEKFESSTSKIVKLLSDASFKRSVDQLDHLLSESVKRRIESIPKFCKNCVTRKRDGCQHPKLGVLFSGGLDSTVLAAFADRCLADSDEAIDLLNVAFEQSDGTFDVPDRITALKALTELQSINPGRKFNLVLINVGKKELIDRRDEVITHLLHPLSTVLDDSIGCAIWFAARGRGHLFSADHDISSEVYISPVRVLLLGAGADEQLAGYSRHRMRFQKSGLTGLSDEIRLEMERISERNLGRDNRIVSDHGVEGRYPYLDENVVSFLNSLPLQDKCDLRLERGLGEKLLLRGVAFNLGLRDVAFEPKRAIQFGSRIARMENRKEKATDHALRL